jgi:hypothetical protein
MHTAVHTAGDVRTIYAIRLGAPASARTTTTATAECLGARLDKRRINRRQSMLHPCSIAMCELKFSSHLQCLDGIYSANR